jgi:transcription factor E
MSSNMHSILDDQEIHDYIQAKAGSLGLIMVQLIEQGFTTIDELAEELRMPRRATRKVLYQMNKEWILGYKRFRKENKINFQWFPTPEKIHRMVRNTRTGEIKDLEERIQFEQDHKFFECCTCKSRCLYTEAMDFGFICERCGEALTSCDNSTGIDELKAQLKKHLDIAELDTRVIDDTGEISEGHRPVNVEDIGSHTPGSSTVSKKRAKDTKKKEDDQKAKDEEAAKPDDDPFKEEEEEDADEKFMMEDD